MSVVAHEYAHGLAALNQGDPTAAENGRLTLNPIKHIDPWMSILLPAMLWFGSGGRFVFGGAKPVPVNPANFRNYRRGDIIVSIAGVVANLMLIPVFMVLVAGVGILANALPTLEGMLATVQRMFLYGIWLNALLAVFNLIPIPPLDGSHILKHFLPEPLARKYREIARYGIIVLLAFLFLFRDAFFILLSPAVMITQLAVDIVRSFVIISAPF